MSMDAEDWGHISAVIRCANESIKDGVSAEIELDILASFFHAKHMEVIAFEDEVRQLEAAYREHTGDYTSP